MRHIPLRPFRNKTTHIVARLRCPAWFKCLRRSVYTPLQKQELILRLNYPSSLLSDLSSEQTNHSRKIILVLEGKKTIEIHKVSPFLPSNSTLFSSHGGTNIISREKSPRKQDRNPQRLLPKISTVCPTPQMLCPWLAGPLEHLSRRKKASIVEGPGMKLMKSPKFDD